MPELRPPARWSLAVMLCSLVAAASVLVVAVRLSSGTSDSGSPSTGSPLRASAATEHKPWYGLDALTAAINWHEVPSRNPAPQVKAAAGILVDIDRGEILWQRAPHASLSPASTTKILTALVALENFQPDQVITVTPDALHQETDETLMGLVAGEKLSVRELLTGALMVSGNDAATVLAVDTVGMAKFVAAMNGQARALGLRDSHFATPVGLEDAGQKASAYDMAVIATTAADHFPLFSQIVSSVHEVLPATPTHHAFELYNLNQLLTSYPGAVGVKPGWTGDAGPCLVGMAERGGHRLVSVLLNSPFVFAQSRQLLDWGFVEEGLPPALPPTPPPAPQPAAATTPPGSVSNAAHRTR